MSQNGERELSDITGVHLPVNGRRGGEPRLVWRSVLPVDERDERARWDYFRTQLSEANSGWKWLLHNATELAAVVTGIVDPGAAPLVPSSQAADISQLRLRLQVLTSEIRDSGPQGLNRCEELRVAVDDLRRYAASTAAALLEDSDVG